MMAQPRKSHSSTSLASTSASSRSLDVAAMHHTMQSLASAVDVCAPPPPHPSHPHPSPMSRGLPGGSPASISMAVSSLRGAPVLKDEWELDERDSDSTGAKIGTDGIATATTTTTTHGLEAESNCNRQEAFFKETVVTPTKKASESAALPPTEGVASKGSVDVIPRGMDFQLKEAQIALKAGQYERVQCLLSLHAPSEGPEATLKAWYTVRYGLAVRLKQYDTALIWVQKCLELNPLDVEVYNFMGMVNLQRKDYNQARKSFDASLALSPNNDVAKSGLGAVEKAKIKEANQ